MCDNQPSTDNLKNVKFQPITLLPDSVNKSIFQGMKCKEYIHVEKIYGFINSNMGVQFAKGHKSFHAFECEMEQIKQYLTKYNKQENAFLIEYALKSHGFGRIASANGSACASQLHRPTRHGLLEDEYEDWDMANCQVVIMVELMRREGILLSQWDEYVRDHQRFRKLVMEKHGVSKDSAKQLFLRMVFGGKYRTWYVDFDAKGNMIPEVVAMEKQVSMVMDYVFDRNTEMLKSILEHKKRQSKIKNRKVKDPKKEYASFKDDIPQQKRTLMGNWAQTIERLIQEKVVKYLVDVKEFKIEEVIPSQDGIAVRKGLSYEGMKEDMERITLEEFGLPIKWDNKPFDEAIHIPTADELIIDKTINDAGNYSEFKMILEKTSFKIHSIGSFYDDGHTKSRDCMRTTYEQYGEVDEKGKETKWIDKWMKDKNMLVYDRLGSFPRGKVCPKNVYNTWKDFDYVDYPVGDFTPEQKQKVIDTINNHFFILLGRNEAYSNWFMRFHAHGIQYPAEKTGHMPILSSKEEGSGKSTVMRFQKALVGDKRAEECIDPKEQVLGRFNAKIEHALFVCMEEVETSLLNDKASKLRGMLTSNTQWIENKNEKGYNQDYAIQRFITFTNDLELNITEETRRLVFFKCSPELKGNKEHFDELHEVFADNEKMRVYVNYLLEMDVSNFRNELPPLSEGHRELVEMTKEKKGMNEDWLDNLVSEYEGKFETLEMYGKEIMEHYRTWSGDKNTESKQMDTMLIKRLKANDKFKNFIESSGKNKRGLSQINNKQMNGRTTVFNITGLRTALGRMNVLLKGKCMIKAGDETDCESEDADPISRRS